MPLPDADPALSLPGAIVVMGVSGCGKSTLGAMLAETLGCAFLEGDDFHSAQAVEKMRGGSALTDEDRWPWLDRLGGAMAGAIAPSSSGRPGVVAACSALRKVYRDRLRAAVGAAAGVPVHFVFLENSRDELLARLGNRPGHYMPASLLDSQLATLEPPTAEEGAIVLPSGLPPAILRGRVLDWIG